jgi:hypothetical protein
MNHSTYVGPYLHCSVRTSPLTKTVKVCPHFKCRFHDPKTPMADQNLFCPQCGRKAEETTVKVEGQLRDDIDSYQLSEDTDERLAQYNGNYPEDGLHLFIPNLEWPREFSIERSCGEVLRVRAVLLEQEMSWFENAFKDGIAKAAEIYGADKISVRWGVLGQYG